MMATSRRAIGWAGTVARTIIGIGLILVAVQTGVGWPEVVGAALVLPAVAIVTAMLVNRLMGSGPRPQGRKPWSGSQIFAALAVILGVITIGVGLTFVTAMDGGAPLLLFYGGSMLIAAGVGYEGCEVLALPNLVFGRTDAIWCPVYSPLDRAEAPHTPSTRVRP